MLNSRRQSGFTLVEIAIVLVIVGLLLAGVLKGQELIENSKIKNIAKDMDSISSALLSYRDRYQNLPGDSTTNTQTAYGWGANVGTAGNNNGLLGDAVPDFAGGSAEQVNAFRAMRYAGFLSGNPTSTGTAALPTHAGGGLMALGGQTAGVMGLAGNVLCLNGLSGKFAGALDRMLDDGVNTTGIIRGTTAVTIPSGAPGTVQYSEAVSNFTICKTI